MLTDSSVQSSPWHDVTSCQEGTVPLATPLPQPGSHLTTCGLSRSLAVRPVKKETESRFQLYSEVPVPEHTLEGLRGTLTYQAMLPGRLLRCPYLPGPLHTGAVHVLPLWQGCIALY